MPLTKILQTDVDVAIAAIDRVHATANKEHQAKPIDQRAAGLHQWTVARDTLIDYLKRPENS